MRAEEPEGIPHSHLVQPAAELPASRRHPVPSGLYRLPKRPHLGGGCKRHGDQRIQIEAKAVGGIVPGAAAQNFEIKKAPAIKQEPRNITLPKTRFHLEDQI